MKGLFLLWSGRLFHCSEETVPSISVKQTCFFFFREPNDGGFSDDMVLRDKSEEPWVGEVDGIVRPHPIVIFGEITVLCGFSVQPLSNKEDAEPNPLIVPGKGKFIRVYPWNMTLLRNTLVMHEGKQAEIKNDTLYVDGKPTQHCYFTKDYYWMGSNNTLS